MEHHVFKDLVPAYLEGLTSPDTSREMQLHMDQCEACRHYVNEMKEEIDVEGTQEKKVEKESIDYFKTVRRKNRKKLWLIASSIVSVFLILIAIYYFMFVNMWLADTNNVETAIQRQGEEVTLSFKSDKTNHYLLTVNKMSEDGYIDSVFVYEKRNDFSNSAKLLKDGIHITYTFLDENTLLLDNGEQQTIYGDDKITIQYKDRTDEISLKDLYDVGNE